ncbi:MAG TPA: tetratricopeptide repeat protein [Candidatus Rifleibacterium sp.]|nr:tetratricopeptide repeat protein [Candidatus Rifleibacterium sp.]HPT45383.1 tetratricopeptide repeat protein [Candidatus Rifleibacterium sp.]
MRCLKLLFLLTTLLVLCVGAHAGVPVSNFFMGEDVLHPSGFVLTVNECKRQPFQSGLGGQSRQDEVFINLTMVNTGVKTFNIDPLKDFELELLNSFPATLDQEGRAAKVPFNVFPSTQSRIDLYFKIDSEQKVTPVLIFKLEDSSVGIICDPELEKLFQKAQESQLNTDEAIVAGQALIDAGRFSSAEKIVRPACDRDPENTRLLMQMASIEDANYNRESAAAYLQRINPANITTHNEAFAVAKMAVSQGFYPLAIAVLEPFMSTNRLENSQKLLLARAYYYENRLTESEQLLAPLLSAGIDDQNAWFTMGNLYDKKNELEKAVEHWEKAVTIDPDYAEAQFNLGVGYFKLKKLDKARECWERVRLLKPASDTLQAAEEALKATEY